MASGFTALAGYDAEDIQSGQPVKKFLLNLLQYSGHFDNLPSDFESLADLILNPELLLEFGAEESVIAKLQDTKKGLKKNDREKLARIFF